MKNLITIFLITLSALSYGQIDRTKAPNALPNPAINIPTPKIVKLENGLKVIIVENHKLPKISFQLFIDNPPMLEKSKVGLSELVGDMLGSGTVSYSKTDFDEAVDYIGASFSSSGRGFFASSLTKHSDKLLKMLKSVILEPSFPEDEFERIKKQYLAGLSANKSDPSAMAGNVGNVINYGTAHSYGEVMTEATVNNITIEDIKAYFKNYFGPQNAYLVIVGDVTEEKAKTIAETYFGGWPKNESMELADHNTVPEYNGNQVYFVNKPGAVQSVIKITHTLDLKPGHEDVVKLSVLNSILGGGSFSARLMSNLREDKAYTYGCYSSIQSDILKGEFTAGGSFRNDVTDSAITQILYEIDKIASELVTDAELDIVKKSKTGAFARSLENPQTVARFALNTIRYNLPADYYANYLKKIEAVTKDDLLQVAKMYLRPKNLSIIVVGNEEIANKLSVFDSNSNIDFKDGYGNSELKLKAAPENVTAATIINNYSQKIYMTDDAAVIAKKDKKIRFISRQYEGLMVQMGAAFELTTSAAYPNKEAMQLTVQGNVMQKEYFNGVTGKTESMMGAVDFDEAKIIKKKETSFPFLQLYYLSNEIYTLNLLGIDNIDGKAYYKIEIKNSLSEGIVYEYYNVENGLLEIKESIETNEKGETVESKVVLMDYKMYGSGTASLLLSSKQTMNNNGNVIELTLKSVDFEKSHPKGYFEGKMD